MREIATILSYRDNYSGWKGNKKRTTIIKSIDTLNCLFTGMNNNKNKKIGDYTWQAERQYFSSAFLIYSQHCFVLFAFMKKQLLLNFDFIEIESDRVRQGLVTRKLLKIF